MRAVVVVVPRVVVAVHEVPAADVVDVAVAVVVDAVGRRSRPGCSRCSAPGRVVPRHAAVDHGHHGRGAAAVAVPRLRRVDVVVGGAGGMPVDGLAGVVQPPQAAEQRVVRRRRRGVVDPVGLGIADVAARCSSAVIASWTVWPCRPSRAARPAPAGSARHERRRPTARRPAQSASTPARNPTTISPGIARRPGGAAAGRRVRSGLRGRDRGSEGRRCDDRRDCPPIRFWKAFFGSPETDRGGRTPGDGADPSPGASCPPWRTRTRSEAMTLIICSTERIRSCCDMPRTCR